MCEPVTIAMAVMAVAGAASGASAQAKAEGAAEDSRRAGLIGQIRQMNAANADSNLEMADKNEQARQQLSELNLTSVRNKGIITTAISESMMSGNSMNRIKRVSEAETSRERMTVVDNHGRDYQALFANQVGNVENMKSALKGSQPIMKTSKVAHALNVASAGMGGAAQGAALKGQMNSNAAAAKGGS